MPIRHRCPCGRMLVIPRKRASQPVQCPACQAWISAAENTAPEPLTDVASTTSETAKPPVPPPVQPSPKREAKVPGHKPHTKAPFGAPSDKTQPTRQDAAGPNSSDESDVSAVTSAQLPEAEKAVIEIPPRQGIEHSASQRQLAYSLAAAVMLVDLALLIPVVMDFVAAFQVEQSPAIWSLLLAGVTGLHIAYCVYLVQLPDWGTVWVMALVQLATATLSASLLGIRLLAGDSHAIIRWLQLDGNAFTPGQESGWLFLMLLFTAGLAYFAARIARQWHTAFRVLVKATG